MSWFSIVEYKRALADRINESLKRFTIRVQRLLILFIGIAFAITGLCQVYVSWTAPVAAIARRTSTFPKDFFTDSITMHSPRRVIGVLVPNHTGTGDSLWVAASASRRFFINNRIRWLELPLDSLKAFGDTHRFVPLR